MPIVTNPMQARESFQTSQFATIADVARVAGVSTATVSRVVNGSTRVSPKTADAVRRALATCRYQPNADAIRLRQLRKERSERNQFGD
jgi:DNA-binding LacI/PurR family transcriptional regulator